MRLPVQSNQEKIPNSTVPKFSHGELDNAELTRALKSLDLQLRHRIEGLLEGNFLGVIPGLGSEPGEHRIYQIGDDVRRIDWNATARTTQIHIRQTVADRELEVWLVIDLSASLNFGSAACTKRDLAVLGAAAMIRLLSGRGNRIGAIILNGDSLQVVPAASSPGHAMTLLRTVVQTRSVSGDKVDLDNAFMLLKKIFRKKGLVAVVSDFLGDLNWEQSFRGVAAHHTVIAIEVLDPRDYEIPTLGEVTLYDPESHASRNIYITKKVRDLYERAASEHAEAIAKIFRKYRVPTLHLNTAREWSLDFLKFVAQYKRIR